MSEAFLPRRRCLNCNAVELIASAERTWPVGWRCPTCEQVVPQANSIPMFAPELANTISGFDPKAFDLLAALEPKHFWFIPRNQLIVGLANKYFPKARRFMEVGCGTGFVLRAIAGSRNWERLVGSELHPAGLDYARKRLPFEVEFVQMDARHIPAAGAFDLTGAFDVIEHIADDEAVLRNLRAATQTGGGTIVTVPQHPWLWSGADEAAHHVRRYRRGELESKFRRNGFDVLFSSSYTALLLPFMAVSRLMTGREDQDDALSHEFWLNRRLNTIFTIVLCAEIRITLAGFRWPMGGSRIVVGRAI